MTLSWAKLAVALACAGVVAAAGLLALSRERQGRQGAERELEAARLKLDGQIAAAQASDAELRRGIAEQAGSNAALRKALEDAQRAAPGAKPERAASLATAALAVSGAPRPAEAPPAPPTAPQGPSAPAPAAAAACVLAQGDEATISVSVVELRTEAGNLVVVGAAEAFRERPLPRARLFGGAFREQASKAQELAAPRQPRWGAGLLGLCGPAGCAAGPVVLFPPADLWLRWEFQAGAAAGPGGAFLLAGVAARF